MTEGCKPSIVAPGMVAIYINVVFSNPTMLARATPIDGISSAANERYRMRVAAGMTMKLVRRK
jgi:hypothetical protein